MEKKISVEQYFRLPETMTPMELIYGHVREPAMPSFGHGAVRIRMLCLLDSHIREHKLGVVGEADVVLDPDAALVVQPDILFVSTARTGIIRERVWGAPDLVVEIASPSTEYQDRTLKLEWYRRYGVRECWLVYPKENRIEIVNLEAGTRESFTDEAQVRSTVLPEFRQTVRECFN